MNDDLVKLIEDAIKSIPKRPIYFANSINPHKGDSHDNPNNDESNLIKVIQEKLSKFNVYNPNQKQNHENYLIWENITGNGMNYFFDVILQKMSAGIFLPFEDGHISPVVYDEMIFFLNREKNIWETDNLGNIKPVFELDEERKLPNKDTRSNVYSG